MHELSLSALAYRLLRIHHVILKLVLTIFSQTFVEILGRGVICGKMVSVSVVALYICVWPEQPDIVRLSVGSYLSKS